VKGDFKLNPANAHQVQDDLLEQLIKQFQQMLKGIIHQEYHQGDNQGRNGHY
jgi:hypothetical protein